MEILFLYIHHRIQGLCRIQYCTTAVLQNSNYGRYLYMGGTVNMGGKVLCMVIHLYNSCTQYSTLPTRWSIYIIYAQLDKGIGKC